MHVALECDGRKLDDASKMTQAKWRKHDDACMMTLSKLFNPDINLTGNSYWSASEYRVMWRASVEKKFLREVVEYEHKNKL